MRFPFPTLDAKISFRVIAQLCVPSLKKLGGTQETQQGASRLCGGHRSWSCWLHDQQCDQLYDRKSQPRQHVSQKTQFLQGLPFPVTCTVELTKTDPLQQCMDHTICNTVEEGRGGSSPAAQLWESATCHCHIVKVTLINSCISCLNKMYSERGSKQTGQLMNEQYSRLDMYHRRSDKI